MEVEKMKNLIISAVILSVWACAVNPHTGAPVITMGKKIVWRLESIYTYESEDLAHDLAILLTELGYSLATISKDPLLIKTEMHIVGEPWVRGIQRYKLGIYPAGRNKFRLKIEALMPLAQANNPNPIFADGMVQWAYDAIMAPLNEVFAERGWKRLTENSSHQTEVKEF